MREYFKAIDQAFSDYIIEQEGGESDELRTLTLCLSFRASQGHSALPVKLLDGCLLEHFLADPNINDLVLDFSDYLNYAEKYPKTISCGDRKTPIILDKDLGLVYLNKYYHAEQVIVEFIQKSAKTEALDEVLHEQIRGMFPKGKFTPDWQRVAAFMALRSQFCVISGGPGTGKTYTVAKILALLLKQNPDLNIDLLAPTGKAADRLCESIVKSSQSLLEAGLIDEGLNIPTQAQTIHRYLGVGTNLAKAEIAEKASDLILLDESSMVSLPLFFYLLGALKEGCRVILLGDKDQLEAVETGNVLGDLTSGEDLNFFSESFCKEYSLLSSEPFNYVSTQQGVLQDVTLKLVHTFRFDDSSPIGALARIVNEPPKDLSLDQIKNLFSADQDDIALHGLPDDKESFVEKHASIKKFFDEYLDLLKDASPEAVLEKLKEIRILCATRQGEFGVEMLNESLSSHFFKSADTDLYHGRCIMINRNEKALNLFNGDVGVILHVDGIAKAYFMGSELRVFSSSILPEFETAFAMTIHKSQGSQFNRVIMPLQSSEFLTRQLLYTGITRASEHVEILASSNDILYAVKNSGQRYSGLKAKLKLNNF